MALPRSREAPAPSSTLTEIYIAAKMLRLCDVYFVGAALGRLNKLFRVNQ